MPKVFSPAEYIHIINLPKDKTALDFIKNKLSVRGSPEQNEVLEELFEMHRTSTGFDPISLSKGRFKRIKASAFRQILSEINSAIPSIIDSDEYREYLQKQNRSIIILEKLKLVKGKIEKVDFVNLEKEVQELREQITLCESRDLLTALANLFNPLSKENKRRNPN